MEDKLEKLLELNIAKMIALESELESTQMLLVNMFSANRENMRMGTKSVKENFDRMRDCFNEVFEKLFKTKENEGEASEK